MKFGVLDKLRDVFRPLNRPPGRDWQDRAVHHGYRVVAILGIAFLLPWLFPRETLPELDGLDEGTIAPRDVIARVGFGVTKSGDQLEAERREAEGGIRPVFALQRTANDTAAVRAHDFFMQVGEASAQVRRTVAEALPAEGEDPPPVDYSPIEDVLAGVGLRSPSPEQLPLLADSAQLATLHAAVETASRDLLDTLVAPSPDLEEVFSRNVIIREGGNDRVLETSTILVLGDFLDEAMASAPRGMSAAGLQLYQSFLVTFFEPTLRLDVDEYRRDREQAREGVPMEAGFVLENERIITANTLIGTADKRKLEAYEAELIESGLARRGTGFWRGMGVTLFGMILLGLLGSVAYFFRRNLYEDFRSFSVLFFLVLMVLVVAGLVAGTESPAALIPIAFAGLLIGALFDSMLAVVVVAVLTALLIGQPVFEGVTVPFITLAAGWTAALSIREINRRSQSWLLIAVITGAYLVSGVALLLLGEIVVLDLFETVLWGGVNATLSTALALGAALPAAEAFTGRTTNQTLLELADLNRPMLRRLSREAPGTYAHSINVANLSEAACSAVGADALLTRVGAYYHDIGKMFRPQYFIENQPLGLNPHDRLLPTQSAEILREHVREGLRLADEARLPEVIKDFIREHHGTATISYFLAKARQQESELHLDPNDFCYPGPKPQSRETAVVMLADAVESTSRTLRDPSPERIRALIDRLVETRIDEDQLNECSLTLRDLDVVKSEFAHILTGLYHHRIDYPVEGGAQPMVPAVPGDGDQALASDTGPAPSLEPQQTAADSGELRVLKEWRPPGGKLSSRPAERAPDPHPEASEPQPEPKPVRPPESSEANTAPVEETPDADGGSEPATGAEPTTGTKPINDMGPASEAEQPSLHPLLGSTPPRRHPGG